MDELELYYTTNDDGIWIICCRCSTMIKCGLTPLLSEVVKLANDHLKEPCT